MASMTSCSMPPGREGFLWVNAVPDHSRVKVIALDIRGDFHDRCTDPERV